MLQVGRHEKQTPRNRHVVSPPTAKVYLEGLEEDKESIQESDEMWDRKGQSMGIGKYP